MYIRRICVNTFRPRQNGRHFSDDIFKWIFLNENAWISINISLKFVPRGPINNIPTLVQVMAWRRPGDKPLLEPMMVRLPTHMYRRICASLGLNDLKNSFLVSAAIHFSAYYLCELYCQEINIYVVLNEAAAMNVVTHCNNQLVCWKSTFFSIMLLFMSVCLFFGGFLRFFLFVFHFMMLSHSMESFLLCGTFRLNLDASRLFCHRRIQYGNSLQNPLLSTGSNQCNYFIHALLKP